MDKKEFLKRMFLWYAEPRLAYIPWREKSQDIEVIFINHFSGDNDRYTYDTNNVIGGIFSLDGKFIYKVDFSTTTFKKCKLKFGEYVYKEAVSPNAHALCGDISFTVSKKDKPTKHIDIQHSATQSFYVASYVKNSNVNTITDNGDTIIYDTYDIIVRQYALKDGQKYKNINSYNTREIKIEDDQPLIREFTSDGTLPNGFLYNTNCKNYLTKKTELWEDFYKRTFRRMTLQFGHFMKEPTSEAVWTINSYVDNPDYINRLSVSEKLYGDYLYVLATEDTKNNDSELTNREKWMTNVTKQDLLDIYTFIKDSHMSGKEEKSNQGWVRTRYSVYVDNSGNYHTDCTDDTMFGISAYIYYYTTIAMLIPCSLAFRESKNAPEEEYKYFGLNVTDYILDTEKYFHLLSDDYTPTTYGMTGQLLGIDPKPQVNQELLEIINNSTGGET